MIFSIGLLSGGLKNRDKPQNLTNRTYDEVEAKTISILHGCMVWIEDSVTRVTDRHHEAC